MTDFVVVARVVAEPGHEANVSAEIRKLIGPTRQEVGCLSYDIYPHAQDAQTSLIYEVWESCAHWRAHVATDHLQAFKKNVITNHATMTVDKFQKD